MSPYGEVEEQPVVNLNLENDERSPEAVRGAAAALITKILDQIYDRGDIGGGFRNNLEEQQEMQSLMAQFQMAQIASNLPLASVGTCHCGNNLFYKGRSDGLFICCSGNPEHCWKQG